MDYLQTNKNAWDRRTPIHIDSKMYDVAGFITGKSSLNSIELEALPSLRDKQLIHLQCHFGLDTLSLERLGAKVTGVDFSSVAIDKAKAISAQLQSPAQFHCCDVYETHTQVADDFDIVFTSYGVLEWLPSVQRWAEEVGRLLRPGGELYLFEFNPDVEESPKDGEPLVVCESTYTENAGDSKETLCVWHHAVDEVLYSLTEQGLEILEHRTYPYSPYNCFPDLEQREHGRYYPTESNDYMVYFVRAKKRS